ncbi:cytochrome P450 [Nemania serpens]|nr:cytochrome P450 [Nemania serpens]
MNQSLSALAHASPLQAGLAAGALSVAYIIGVFIYRLYLHPLRHVPGPRLAALTRWTETYYECFKSPGGQFMWEYQKWHEQYGPIVRVGPDEVHIQDLRFYNVLNSNSRHPNKLRRLDHRFNNQLGVHATVEHSLHRKRRAALNPFFSKREIARHSPNIQQVMDRLCERVATEYLNVDNDSILSLSRMWEAFTGDVVVGYCLEKSYDFIMNPDFRAEFSEAMISLLEPVHFITQFPWIIKTLKLLPDWLVAIISPPMSTVLAFNNEMKAQIIRAKQIHSSGEKHVGANESSNTLFTAILESDLPPQELEIGRLQHEAIGLIGGAVETTSYALIVCSYHVLSNKDVLEKLRSELRTAIPRIQDTPDVDTLMRLPYLTSVINEALRFSYGTPQRMPRLYPTPIIYSSPDGETYHLPVGSIISMDNYTASHDSWAFPSPFEFRPGRWENDPRAPDGKSLSTYLVAFSRGTRNCVGMQLAYAELYIGLATFFRRFDCELFETGRDAVDCYYDRFVPKPKPGTHGVRVKVLDGLS